MSKNMIKYYSLIDTFSTNKHVSILLNTTTKHNNTKHVAKTDHLSKPTARHLHRVCRLGCTEFQSNAKSKYFICS